MEAFVSVGEIYASRFRKEREKLRSIRRTVTCGSELHAKGEQRTVFARGDTQRRKRR